MNTFLAAIAVLIIFYIWASFSGRKLRARIERIRRIHGPDAKICYMNVRGKRYTMKITIESVRPRGQDWVVVAWCHEKNEFLVFYASRMYEYFDMKRYENIKNVPAYFTERFGHKAEETV